MDDRTREILEKLSTDEESRGWLNTELTDVIQERTRQAMGQYLQTFADRVPGELKLETKTFRTHPLGFIQVVLDTPTDSSTDHTLGAGDRLRSSRLSKKARQAVAYRESSRLARAQLFGMVRAIVRAVGENLVGAGHLDNVEDVFYLTIDELFTTTEDCPSIVAARQHQWKSFEEHDPPSRLLLDDQGQPHGSPVDADDLQSPSPTFEGTPVHVTTVAGIPVSVGVVEAEVVVVTDPSDGIDATGKILVARSTDPGWVFLMRQSVGIIAERGSLLSHAAIVARELGLPCVVGAPDVTTWLTTGDLVRLDGSTGHIEKMDGTHDR
jgi:pyruvate,water dikinase